MNLTKTWCHSGTFGDTIYSLVAMKLLGPGRLVIKLNNMDSIARSQWGPTAYAGVHSGRYTRTDVEFMRPLLEHQSYVTSVDEYTNQLIDIDLDKQRLFTTKDNREAWQGNQTECYALACGIDIVKYQSELNVHPWLEPVAPTRITNRPIVISRTDRYLQGSSSYPDQWAKWIAEGLSDTAVFVGSKSEQEEFNRKFNCNVPYYPVNDMLELASVISGCEQFIGNQSMPLSIAIGLGKTFWCETRKDWETFRSPHGFGDVWFPRINGHYF